MVPKIVPNKKKKLTAFAQHDKELCMTSGLFRTFKRGEERPRAIVQYKPNLYETLEFRCFWQLGVDDLRFLQAAVAIADCQRKSFALRKPETEVQNELVNGEKGLKPKDLALAKGQALTISNITFKRLAEEMGLEEGGSSIKAIKESIDRWGSVTVKHVRENTGNGHYVPETGRTSLCGVMSCVYRDDGTIEQLALNPRFLDAMIGEHARIEMAEVRVLKSDHARLIHQRLSAQVRHGGTSQFRLGTLMGYVWPEIEGQPKDVTPEVIRDRRRLTRKAMEEIHEIGGWKVSYDEARNDFWVERAARSGQYAKKKPAKRGQSGRLFS
jgi:hypothetical protein